MVQATYISGSKKGTVVSKDELETITGVIVWKLNPISYKKDGTFDKLSEERGYTIEEEIVISPSLAKYAEIMDREATDDFTFDDEIEITQNMPRYAEKIAYYHNEHLHCEEEVLFITKGAIFIDVRDARDNSWIRMEANSGHFFILPAGSYHRLTFKDRNPVTLRKLYTWKPVWPCYFRSEETDDFECRKSYLDSYKNKNVTGNNCTTNNNKANNATPVAPCH